MQPPKKKGGAFMPRRFHHLWEKTEIMVVVFRGDKQSFVVFCLMSRENPNEGRRGSAARCEEVPWMIKSTYKGFKTFISAQWAQ